MWFAMEKTELDYLDRAPFRLENEILCFAPAERVFDVLTGVDASVFHEWLEDLVEVRWTSGAPYGVGTTREVVIDALKTGAPKSVTHLAVKERFLAWERGKRLAFAIEASTMPLIKQMVEEMTLERRGDKTLLRYTVHYTPSLAMRAIHPVARVAFGKMFRDATRKVAMIAARSSVTSSRAEAARPD